MHTAIRPSTVGRGRGFTLVELLVVIAIISILISLILPGMNRARFHANVVHCHSNYHQWGAAASAYALDHRSFLPRQDINRGTGRNTWDVSNEFVRQMYQRGMIGKLWGCPIRADEVDDTQLNTEDDAVAYFSRRYGDFSIIPQNWWVPRRFGAGSPLFPSPDYDPLADPRGWPTRPNSDNADTQPIMTDLCGLSFAFAQDQIENAIGGHAYQGRLESTTAVFADGHAELRTRDELAVQFRGNWQNLY